RISACANFGFLGLKLDAAKNAQASVDQEISLSDSTVRVLVVHAQEDWAIARDCWRLISARSQGHARVIYIKTPHLCSQVAPADLLATRSLSGIDVVVRGINRLRT